jgi:uncharacterized phage protein (TIGR02220 family)
MRILGVFHDSEEYGVVRYPLTELARAAGVPLRLATELVGKGVLKGADSGASPYVHVPRHAGKDGEPVTLVEPGDGPCWYSSRMVRDEWLRQRRGGDTRFTPDRQPTRAPTRPMGEPVGDGASSASSSSASKPQTPKGEAGLAPGAVHPVNGKSVELKIAARRVLAFVNEKTGRNFREVDANLKPIMARIREGATEGQCRQVIASKVREWQDDPEMSKHLNPETLFRPSKFAKYLGALDGPQIDKFAGAL